MNINTSTLLLTGATGGIGRALARALSDAGARLLLVGRNEKGLAQLKNELGVESHYTICADLETDEGRQTVYHICQQQGIDGLINNAGISEFNLFQQQVNAARIIHVNLTSPVLLCQLLLPVLQLSNKPMIVNVGSAFGSIGYPGYTAYCASKFGLRGFSQALRRELADSNLRVLYVAPRACRTDINDARVNGLNEALGNAMDEPADVAREIVAAMHNDRVHELYLGWPEKLFVRINALIPSLVDGSLLKQLPIIRRFSQQQ